ncbi:hypothetical protein ACFO0N_11640 [Halobium salinum]|uniref:Tat (Twin-arginine translocation) pathway signal sequence n=1 Tax=Halobium salinum TaxID=1364940 RepID=A0ABD5PD10_9EURY|nr:hypothetical protein [Halobium salinum]
MSPHSNRRSLLRAGSLAAAASFAGCVSLPFVNRPIDVLLLNRHDEPHEVKFEALRFGGDAEYSERLAHREWYDLSAADESGVATVRLENLLPSGAYLARFEVDREWTASYHYFPDCAGREGGSAGGTTVSRSGTDDSGSDTPTPPDDGPPEDGFVAEITRTGGGMVFGGAFCSDDSWFL